MIKKIEIKNFKGIGDPGIEIELKPMTLLFGPNSAGKSTIFQTLIYAREVFLNNNLDAIHTELGGSALDLGGFKNLVHNQNIKNVIEIKLHFNIDYEDLNDCEEIDNDDYLYKLFSGLESLESAWIKFLVGWDPNTEKAFIAFYEIGLNQFFVVKIGFDPHPTTKSFYYEDINYSHPFISEIEEFIAEPTTFDESQNKPYLSPGFNPFKKNRYINHFVPGIIKADVFQEKKDISNHNNIYVFLSRLIPNINEFVLETLNDFLYIGPLREVPQRNFIPENNTNLARWFNGLAAYDSVYNQPEIVPDINFWLNKLKIDYKINLQEYIELPVQSDIKSTFEAGIFESFTNYVNLLQQLKDSVQSWSNDYKLKLYKLILEFERMLSEQFNESTLGKFYSILTTIKEELNEDYINQIDNIKLNINFFNDDIKVFNDHFQNFNFLSEISNESSKYKRYKKLYFLDKVKDTTLSLNDLGVGISQVFPIVVANLAKGSHLYAFEQPELHVHPAVQVELADLFIRKIHGKGDGLLNISLPINPILLIETHSEHIILRLLRRIEETNKKKIDDLNLGSRREAIMNRETTNKKDNYYLSPEEINVYWCESTPEGLKVDLLPIDETGEFTRQWPRGFFEERAEELFPDD